MTSHLFALSVPQDHRFRGLAAEIGERYLELLGATKHDCGAFREALSVAVSDVTREGRGHENVDLSFDVDAAGVRVTLLCAGRSAAVTAPLPAGKR